MTDSELHPYVELIAREARRPVATDPAARARIMAAVRAEGAVRPAPSVWQRMFEVHSFRLSPAGSALIAAGLVGIGVIAGVLSNNRGAQTSGGQSQVAVAPSRPPVSDTFARFFFVAPGAAKVSVVGDFNGWDDTKTPMVRAANTGAWSVTLPMPAGRHLYGFVVDGAWAADPNAPLAPDDGFGHANSVKLVRRGSSL